MKMYYAQTNETAFLDMASHAQEAIEDQSGAPEEAQEGRPNIEN
jgi:hypothetical protein